MDRAESEPFRALEDAVLGSAGRSDPNLRRMAFDRSAELARGGDPASDGPSDPLGTVIHKVARYAYRLTEEDVRVLVRSGLSEDSVFEVIVAAAVGAGSARLDAGLRALRDAVAARAEPP